MRVVGLDVATWVGMALLEGEEFRVNCIHFDKVDGCQRLSMIQSAVSQQLDFWKPDLAIMEKPFIGHVSSATTVVSCATVIRMVLYQRKLAWYEVPATTLKQWVTGKGNADKSKMAVSVMQRWGFKSPSDDIVDAYGLARMGQLPLSELLAIKGITKGQ